MEFIQIVAILFAVFAFTRVLMRLKEKKLSILEFILWTLVWASLVLVALFPYKLSELANTVGIQSGTGLVTYSGLIVTFYLIFRLYVKLDTVEREITLLTRESSLKAAKKKRK